MDTINKETADKKKTKQEGSMVKKEIEEVDLTSDPFPKNEIPDKKSRSRMLPPPPPKPNQSTTQPSRKESAAIAAKPQQPKDSNAPRPYNNPKLDPTMSYYRCCCSACKWSILDLEYSVKKQFDKSLRCKNGHLCCNNCAIVGRKEV
ncbi:hypothetical protein EJ08DRAFT_702132 [Tothia fuscella]|uniref:Uncharacterized protein n=1 Tax=Tothia fuscella TaxID=1048955 RepID=A0A9P4TTH8_9PEZI|nr:hypothetical protein EJ08DRAFT_702132 [Tothia fuscella]